MRYARQPQDSCHCANYPAALRIWQFPKLLAQLENFKLEHCSVTVSRSGALTAPKLVVVPGDIGRQFKNWTKLWIFNVHCTFKDPQHLVARTVDNTVGCIRAKFTGTIAAVFSDGPVNLPYLLQYFSYSLNFFICVCMWINLSNIHT